MPAVLNHKKAQTLPRHPGDWSARLRREVIVREVVLLYSQFHRSNGGLLQLMLDLMVYLRKRSLKAISKDSSRKKVSLAKVAKGLFY